MKEKDQIKLIEFIKEIREHQLNAKGRLFVIDMCTGKAVDAEMVVRTIKRVFDIDEENVGRNKLFKE